MSKHELPILIKPQEAAEILHLTRRTIYDLVEKRKIRFYRIGSLIRFNKEDVEEYLRSKKVEAIGK